MTACTNNGGSRARRAVTAALVGVLSVGAAPMVALATGAAPASGDVQLQAVDSRPFELATVDYDNGEPGDSYLYKSDKYLVPTQVILANNSGTIKNLTQNRGGVTTTAGTYYFAYVKIGAASGGVDLTTNGVTYVDDEGDSVSVTGKLVADPTDETGVYAVIVGYHDAAGSWTYVKSADTFKVTNGSFDNATLIENGDASDTTFIYTGVNGAAEWSNSSNGVKDRMGVAIDGVKLDSKYYTIGNCYKLGSTTALKNTDKLVPGTTYSVEVKGQDAYSGVNKRLQFTYGALELEDASVVSVGATTKFDTDDPSSVVKSINGVDVASNSFLESHLSVTLKTAQEDEGTGEYVFTVSGKKDDPYVTGSVDVTVTYADVVADIKYGNQAWDSAFAEGATFGTSVVKDGQLVVDLTQEEPDYFDVDEISVDKVAGKKVDYTVAYANAVTGATATEADLKTAGKWLVTVSVSDKVDGKLVAGSESIVVYNTYKLTEAVNILVSFNDKNLNDVDTAGYTKGSATYTGEDLSGKLSVLVTAGDITFEEGDGYTVSIAKKDVTGKWVATDEIVDAGTYRVTVKGVAFDESGVYEIVISPRTIKSVVPADPFATEVKETNSGQKYNAYYYAATGDEIVPEFNFIGDDGKTYKLDASEYEVSYSDGSDVADLKSTGTYTVRFVNIDADNFVNAKYSSGSSSVTLPKVGNSSADSVIVVTETGSFVDVANDAWYAEEVAIAKQQGYIGGVGGTNFFAPMNNITRADFVCVLYRMAGGSIGSVEEGMTDEEITYISSFEDVDPNAYYAKAVAWATKMGIVNGYGTTFGTERSISTEEFAAMLARYAAKMGTDTSVDADAVLANVADGDKVSSYARDAVAWAVESGYLAKGGNLIDPQGSIYRARAIKIAVDYQPEQLDTILDQGGNAQGRN